MFLNAKISNTLKIASELIDLGVEIDQIYQNLFNNFQFSRINLKIDNSLSLENWILRLSPLHLG